MNWNLSTTMCGLALLGCSVVGVAELANADIISDTLFVHGIESSGAPFSLGGSLTEADEASGNNTITVILPPSVSFIPNAVVILSETAVFTDASDISDLILSSSDGSQLTMTSSPPFPGTFIELLVRIAVASINGAIFPETGLPQDISQFFAPPGSGLTIQVESATPLPAVLPLFASGLGLISLFGWRRKRKAQTGST